MAHSSCTASGSHVCQPGSATESTTSTTEPASAIGVILSDYTSQGRGPLAFVGPGPGPVSPGLSSCVNAAFKLAEAKLSLKLQNLNGALSSLTSESGYSGLEHLELEGWVMVYHRDTPWMVYHTIVIWGVIWV